MSDSIRRRLIFILNIYRKGRANIWPIKKINKLKECGLIGVLKSSLR